MLNWAEVSDLQYHIRLIKMVQEKGTGEEESKEEVELPEEPKKPNRKNTFGRKYETMGTSVTIDMENGSKKETVAQIWSQPPALDIPDFLTKAIDLVAFEEDLKDKLGGI